MKNGLTLIGTLCVLVGVVWALQGADVVGGSLMSGQRLWLVIGIVTAVVGAGLFLLGRRRG